MQVVKTKKTVKRTLLLRIAALIAALVIVIVLGYTVNKQAGNPISAWYTARKIAAHYKQYHSGEGYVVGPAKYQYIDLGVGKTDGVWKPHYLCNVYKTGSVDTGFVAAFQNGAVIACERATTKSGTNTYNRLKNALNADLAGAEVHEMLGIKEGDSGNLFADFYEPDMRRVLFSPDAPVFVPNMPYDRDALPLQTVACLTRFLLSIEAVTDEALARELYALKEACEGAGQPFSVYSVQLYSSAGYTLNAMDVPATQLATKEAAQEYVAGMSAQEKATPPPNFYAAAVLTRKQDWLYSQGAFEVCTH